MAGGLRWKDVAKTRHTGSFPRRREGEFTFEVQHWEKDKREPRWESRRGGTCVGCCCSGGGKPRVDGGTRWRDRFCGGGAGACGQWRFRYRLSAKVCGGRRRKWEGRDAG